ncbi:MAG: hypothetical protein M3Q27_03285 [Actinomycetota bacterium]|nr:hypothetical protein [Actinomycetota bacterium]
METVPRTYPELRSRRRGLFAVGLVIVGAGGVGLLLVRESFGLVFVLQALLLGQQLRGRTVLDADGARICHGLRTLTSRGPRSRTCPSQVAGSWASWCVRRAGTASS